MQVKWIVSLALCASMCSLAQESPKPAAAQPPSQEGKHGGLFHKKPKVELSPEEEAKRKASIQSQIDALPKQGTPMLDETGKQLLDPDAKPMFNPPPRPLLDKHGQPGLDDNGKLLLQTKDNLGYDANGKKLKPEKIKEPKKVPLTIADGTLTVDGWTGKARLNYDIADLKYLYIFAPGIGVTVISNAPFDGATEQKNAFDGKTLTVMVAEHTLQIASEKKLLNQKHPGPAYVRVDREYAISSRFPVMGYGTLRKAPYAWPQAKPVGTKAPPLPKDVLPTVSVPKAVPGPK